MKKEAFEILLSRGEDTKTQFKRDITNVTQLSLEMVAFSNCLGGKLFIGIDDSGFVTGLSDADIRRLNQLVSNAASQNVVPPIYPQTEVVAYEDKKLLCVTVRYGANKPYCTKDGRYVTKSGSDKRMISNEEMKRLFQESGKLYADETLMQNADWNDIDKEMFSEFYEKKFGEPCQLSEL